MTYDVTERSDEGRKPVELFTFYRGTQVFRYTSADRDVVFDGQTFEAAPVSRSAIEATNEMARGSLRITASRFLGVVDLFRIAPPTTPVTFTLQQYHDGDGSAAVLWTGRIVVVEFQGINAQITLEPVYTSMRRMGLRRMYQRQCPHVLYGTACKVVAGSFSIVGAVDTISGSTVSISEAGAQAAGYFAGGFIEYEVQAGITERRFISGHTGSALELISPPTGLQAGQSATMFPGCDHTLTTCSAKFSNVLNYGGMPYFTIKNPFGGTSLY